MATPEEMRLKMYENIPEKTGKTVEEWRQILASIGLEKHGQMVGHLKAEFGITHGFANLLVHDFRAGSDEVRPPEMQWADDPLKAQYEGKEGLRPIYDELLKFVSVLGDDVEVAPKKSYVSLRRSTQFALVQPSTKTRVDLGLKLRNRNANGRLEASGSFNAMVTHRVRLGSVEDVDKEVESWLAEAYSEA